MKDLPVNITLILIGVIFLVTLSFWLCGCKALLKDKTVNNNPNEFYWVPSSSAPQQHPVEVFDVHFLLRRPPEGNTYIFQYYYFGFCFKYAGLASGYNGIAYDENDKYPLPHYIAALWLSFPEKKVYYLDEPLPYDQILQLFTKGYDFYEDTVKKTKITYDELDLCFLPNGKTVLYVKGTTRKTMVDWMAQGTATDEFNDNICKENRCESIEKHINYYANDSALMVNNTFPVDSLINKYFERFSYTINIDLADPQAKALWGKEEYTNGEYLCSRYRSMVESIAMPSRLKYYEVTWDSHGYKYLANVYFNEEEMLQLFDEAYGNDHTQQGVLNIAINESGDTWDISLIVGDKKCVFKKTEIEVYNYPLSNPDDDENIVFKNFENKPQNIFRIK